MSSVLKNGALFAIFKTTQ